MNGGGREGSTCIKREDGAKGKDSRVASVMGLMKSYVSESEARGCGGEGRLEGGRVPTDLKDGSMAGNGKGGGRASEGEVKGKDGIKILIMEEFPSNKKNQTTMVEVGEKMDC